MEEVEYFNIILAICRTGLACTKDSESKHHTFSHQVKRLIDALEKDNKTSSSNRLKKLFPPSDVKEKLVPSYSATLLDQYVYFEGDSNEKIKP